MSKTTKFPWKSTLAKILIAGALSCSLSGCVTTAIVVGGMSVADRRTVGVQTDDKAIVAKGEKLAYSLGGDKGHVNVTSFNYKVLLTGEVDSEATKQKVGKAIAELEHVKTVVNELAIMAPTGMGSRSNDSYLTSKVSSSLLMENNLESQAFKTTTERGTVYLMGRVTKYEGDHAARVAQGVSGVKNVVKVFEYITEEELHQLSKQQKTEATEKSTTEAGSAATSGKAE